MVPAWGGDVWWRRGSSDGSGSTGVGRRYGQRRQHAGGAGRLTLLTARPRRRVVSEGARAAPGQNQHARLVAQCTSAPRLMSSTK
eukprot:COSAG01_NODE_1508_length_10054_cov_3.434713_1_plen_85_part_00